MTHLEHLLQFFSRIADFIVRDHLSTRLVELVGFGFGVWNEVFEKSKQFWNSLFQCIVACPLVGIPGKGRIEGAKIDSTPEIYLYFHVTADRIERPK